MILKQPPCIYLGLGAPPWGCFLGVRLPHDNRLLWPPSIPHLVQFAQSQNFPLFTWFFWIFRTDWTVEVYQWLILKKKKEAQKHFPPKCHYNPKHRGGIQASNSSTHHRQIHQSAFSPSKTIHTSLSLSFFWQLLQPHPRHRRLFWETKWLKGKIITALIILGSDRRVAKKLMTSIRANKDIFFPLK